MNFDVRKTTRRCSSTDQSLDPGVDFYSALIETETGMQRLDFCEQAWEGPPDHCLGWWKTVIPVTKSDRVYWAPVSVRIAYFEQLLTSDPPKMEDQDVAYVLALLLVRQRVLQLADPTELSRPDNLLQLTFAKEKKSYDVSVRELGTEQIAAIQQQLSEHLFQDQPPESA